MKQNDKENFKVTDRRHTAGKNHDHEDTVDPKSAESEKSDSVPLPDVDFSTFLFSLNTSALIHLGEVPDFSSGEKKKELTMAQYTIDTLSMLQEKTSGNLTDDEKGLLEHILFDLRMRFVKASS